MTVINRITDGSVTVNLKDSTGFEIVNRGFNMQEIRRGATEVVESYTVKLTFSSQDNAASDWQTFVKLLDDARYYHELNRQGKPVYWERKGNDETNTRYAMVKDYSFAPPHEDEKTVTHNKRMREIKLSIIREHPWRSNAPGTLGTALTLDASDGPASPTLVAVSNFNDDSAGNITHVFHYDDSTTTFSSNLLSASTGTDLFPSSPAANDVLYYGAGRSITTAITDIATASDWNIDGEWQYYNGSTWSTMTLGTHYTIFGEGAGEITSDDILFTTTGQWAVNVFPPSDWVNNIINGQNRYWIRYVLTTVTSTTTVPEKSDDSIYSQRTPYVAVPAASIKGDSPPSFNIRMYSPSGGDENPGPASLSRIIIGAKSRGLATFTPFLNAGGVANPGEWSVNQGTDASATADTAAPGLKHSLVDFSTDSTMVSRVEFVGDDILDDWIGEYRVFVRVQQTSGDPGDCNVKARFFLGGSAASDPSYDTRERATNGAAQGTEVLDLGFISLPFSRVFNADSSDIDLTIQVHAERVTGSANLEIHDIILMPLDEGAVGLDDFAVDVSSGSGALRGGSVLDVDNGVIANRTIKYWHDGTNLIPASPWARMNKPPDFANIGTDTRLYFLMLHYATGAANWGEEPLIASVGCGLMVEVYGHYRYAVLRGSN